MFLLAFFAIFLCGYVYTRVNRIRRYADKIPGEAPWPIVGNILGLIWKDNYDVIWWLIEWWNKYNRKIFGLWLGLDYYVFLTDPKDVEVILTSPTQISKTREYTFLKPWLGTGLVINTGDNWRKKRKVITPAFHFRILEQYTEVFKRGSDVMIKQLEREANGRVIDIFHYTTLCALDLLMESAMGVNINAQINPNSIFVRSMFDFLHATLHRISSPWERFDVLFKLSKSYREQQKALQVIRDFNDNLISQRAEYLRTRDNEVENFYEDGLRIKKKIAFLDILLTSTIDGENLTNKMIQDEVATFTFGGYDTVASALAFAIYSFANNPKIQQKAYEEQMDIFGNDKTRHPTYQDLQNMPYLDLCIKETLRIYPIAPAIARSLKGDMDINGTIIPSGANVVVFVLAMHRNPKYFKDPEIFDPDRFLPENRTSANHFDYVPFSAGPRNCIGQKFASLVLKTVLSKMLRNYEMVSAGPENDPAVYSELTLKSKNGVMIKLQHRKL